jgi:hypothetical protein
MKTRPMRTFVVLLTILFLCISFQVVANIWRNSYNEQTHDCRQMSYELGLCLQNLGIPVKIIYGEHENTQGNITEAHVWLLLADHVQLDAVTLEIQDNMKYYFHYHVENIRDAAIRSLIK